MLSTQRVTVVNWGRTQYADATERQTRLVGERLAGTVGDTLVFTEHDPVYTVGLRTGAETHLVWERAQLEAEGISVTRTNRGGDITYHGPGQLVGYPIVSLDQRRDLHAYLRFLEAVLIAGTARLGVTAHRRKGFTGIWIGSRKIAAIGVAVRRWVAYHGFALNVAPELNHYAGIVPCGITSTDGSVTSLAAELPRRPTLTEAQTVITDAFVQLWPEFLAGRDL